jgi:methylmalonyl-CoA/ethylmalonyl-CoA epimerase
MISGIYGVNVAVKNLDMAIARYEAVFGVKAERLGPDDFAFPGLLGGKLNIDGFHITLIASSNGNSAVAKFIERRGEGMFLLSVKVEGIEQEVSALKERGLQFLLDETATGAFGAVNFVHPKSMHGVQLEIYQLPE